MTLTQTLVLEEITCGTCGVTHAVPQDWINAHRKEGGSIYCPNGCKRTWMESEADRLRKQLEARERELRESKCETMRKHQLLEDERKLKSALERKLNRVHKGVCPCCRRSFQNLQRHMATKHPELTKP